MNSLAGFLVGLLVGFTGVGGGALMTPLLVLAFGVAPQTAVGTDLLYAAVTKSVGSWVHGVRGAVDWSVARLLWFGSLPASALTLYSMQSARFGEHLARLGKAVLLVEHGGEIGQAGGDECVPLAVDGAIDVDDPAEMRLGNVEPALRTGGVAEVVECRGHARMHGTVDALLDRE